MTVTVTCDTCHVAAHARIPEALPEQPATPSRASQQEVAS